MRNSFAIIAALASMLTFGASGARAADEPDELLPGHIVIIKNAKLAKFVAKPPAGTTFDLPDATNDPTAEGGLLEMFDDSPFTPAGVDFVLPPTGWKGLGNPAGSKGYKYKGAGSPGDACRVVLVKAKVVKAVCKGTGVTLPTPFQGQVGIVLTVGTDSKRYCALFGGDETKNDETLLKRTQAPPPGFCPLDLNSSTTIPNSTSTTVTSSTTTTDTVPAPTTTSTSPTTTASGTITTTSTTLPSTSTTTSTSTTVSHTGTITTTTTSLPVPCDQTHPFVCSQGLCAVGTCVLSGSNVCECQ